MVTTPMIYGRIEVVSLCGLQVRNDWLKYVINC